MDEQARGDRLRRESRLLAAWLETGILTEAEVAEELARFARDFEMTAEQVANIFIACRAGGPEQ